MPAPALDAYLEEFFDGLLTELAHRGAGGTSLRPILHVADEDDVFVVTLPVPGLALEDVTARCSDGLLTILGPHLYRTVYLPAIVEAAGLSMTLQDGLLIIQIPKAP